MLSVVDEEHDLGYLQELSSPVLVKLKEAFVYTKLASEKPRGAFGARTRVIQGLYGSQLHAAFFRELGHLVIAFKSVTECPKYGENRERVNPSWLANIAPDAELHQDFAQMFDHYLDPGGGDKGLAQIVSSLTDGMPPRRITCTGFCTGGAVATIAAVWLALQCPSADVRCITFGAQRVGNRDWVQVFRWLVSTSYRVAYNRDPVPTRSQSLLNPLTHVPGAVYITAQGLQPGKQPLGNQMNMDIADHDLERYGVAMHELCERFLKRDHESGGTMYYAFAACYLKLTGDEPPPATSGSYTWPKGTEADPTADPDHQAVLQGMSPEDAHASKATLLREVLLGEPGRAAEVARGLLGRQTAEEVIAANGTALSATLPFGPAAKRALADSAAATAASSTGKAGITATWAAPAAGAELMSHGHAASPSPGGESTANVSGADVAAANAQQMGDGGDVSPGAQPLGDDRVAGAGEPLCSAESVERQRREDTVMEAVVNEATAGHSAGLATGKGAERGPGWINRAFSLLERENINVDMSHMDTLEKVLVAGKISQAVVVAAAAYRDEATFRERTGITNTKLINDLKHVDTQVHVGWLDSGTAVLSFRGTATMHDGLQDVKLLRSNIDYLQELYPGTRAHTGFLQQFAAVIDPRNPDLNIAAAVRKLSGGRTPTRVLCCGHSLGGALATLGAAWAALEYPQADIRCITFGSPRVGNRAFKKAFHTLVGTSLRIVHGSDPVPFLPPSLAYHHVDGAIHLLRDQVLLRRRPWHFKLRPNLADHVVARYNAGVYQLMPGGVQSMPLPRPRHPRRTQSSDSRTSASNSNGERSSMSRASATSNGSGGGSSRDLSSQGSFAKRMGFLPLLECFVVQKQVDPESSDDEGEVVTPTAAGKANPNANPTTKPVPAGRNAPPPAAVPSVNRPVMVA